MTLAIRRSDGERDCDANKGAVRRRREAQPPHETGSGVSRARFSPAVATALQASSNTYLTGLDTAAAKNGALAPFVRRSVMGDETCARNEADTTTASRTSIRRSRTGSSARADRGHGRTPARGPPADPEEEAPMRDLNYDLKQLCRHNRDGSYATQADREHLLDQIADQLDEMGFRQMDAHGFKPKHVEKLVERWLAERLAAGHDQEPHERSALAGAEDRQGEHRRAHQCRLRHSGSGVRHQRVEGEGPRRRSAGRDPLTSTSGPRCACRPPSGCGARRRSRSSLAWADRGDTLASKASWNKGGRKREVPIVPRNSGSSLTRPRRSPGQEPRRARRTPPTRDYLRHFRYECERVGIHGVHGHRHLYAQRRYQELTGWDCPARGGPTSKQLTKEQKQRDREARLHQPRDGPRSRAGDFGLS